MRKGENFKEKSLTPKKLPVFTKAAPGGMSKKRLRPSSLARYDCRSYLLPTSLFKSKLLSAILIYAAFDKSAALPKTEQPTKNRIHHSGRYSRGIEGKSEVSGGGKARRPIARKQSRRRR